MNDQIAFSRAEIVRGVQCRVSKPAQLGEILAELPNQLAELAADFEAGGVEVAAYSEAVDRLRDAGEIQCSRIARSDGEPVIYYRIAGRETAACESGSECGQ